MSDVSQWATSAASNNSSPPDGWPEAQAPSTVNDCGREMMAAIARLYGDIDGTLETGGSGNSYTITSTQTHAALADQSILVFRVDRANTGAATLNVDSLGAKSMRVNGTALASGQLVADKIVIAAYNATDDAYDLIGAIQSAADLVGELDDARLSSNVPLLDADNTYTGIQTVSATAPRYQWKDTDAGTDEGFWRAIVDANVWRVEMLTDAGAAIGDDPIRITRSGTTITLLELDATSITANGSEVLTASSGVSLTGAQTVAGVKTFSSRPIHTGGILSHGAAGNTGGKVTVSTSDPSGTPAAGDIWIKRES